MRKTLIAIMLLSYLAGHTQKQDYVWLAGYHEGVPNFTDSITHYGAGTSRLDFNYSPRAVTLDSFMDFSRTCITYSDTSGHLLFASNGIQIRNGRNELIEGGDSLNAGWLIYVYDPTMITGPDAGYRYHQEMICVPHPDSNNIFFLRGFF